MKFENLLPVFAPTPAGLVIAIRLYQEIMVAVGYSNEVWQVIAGLGALVGCIGMIGGEMYAYKQAGIALAEGQRKAAFAAFLAALVCSGLVIWAIGTSENTRPLIAAVVVAIAIYIVLAIKDFIGRKVSIVETAKNDEQAKREYDLKMEKMRTSQVLADARKAKSQAPQVAPKVSPTMTKVSESFGGDWRRVPGEHRAKIAGMNTAEIMAEYNVSERTAQNWKNYATKEKAVQ